jgi:hypothetical protein
MVPPFLLVNVNCIHILHIFVDIAPAGNVPKCDQIRAMSQVEIGGTNHSTYWNMGASRQKAGKQ